WALRQRGAARRQVLRNCLLFGLAYVLLGWQLLGFSRVALAGGAGAGLVLGLAWSDAGVVALGDARRMRVAALPLALLRAGRVGRGSVGVLPTLEDALVATRRADQERLTAVLKNSADVDRGTLANQARWLAETTADLEDLARALGAEGQSLAAVAREQRGLEELLATGAPHRAVQDQALKVSQLLEQARPDRAPP